jgi:hypothetical protein
MCRQGDDRHDGQLPGVTGRIFVLTAMAEEAAALGEDLGCRTWTQAAGARFARMRRKTLVVCTPCHQAIHHGHPIALTA